MSARILIQELKALRSEAVLLILSVFSALSFLALVGWHPSESFVRAVIYEWSSLANTIFSLPIVLLLGVKLQSYATDSIALYILLACIYRRAWKLRLCRPEGVLVLDTIREQRRTMFFCLRWGVGIASLVFTIGVLEDHFFAEDPASSEMSILQNALVVLMAPIMYVFAGQVLAVVTFFLINRIYSGKAFRTLREDSLQRPLAFILKTGLYVLVPVALSIVTSVLEPNDAAPWVGVLGVCTFLVLPLALLQLLFAAAHVPRVIVAVTAVVLALIAGDLILSHSRQVIEQLNTDISSVEVKATD
ncbi:MAG: hypothetical protein DHS20C11_13250 [Lysobacteraceae bacterium]|nr:MAG: hypothetical protein DHS20C11_13250 [Xanthomonadaceae bacterium]